MPRPWEPRFAEADARFEPIRRAAAAFAEDRNWPPVASWSARLDAAGLGLPVVFVPQTAPIRRRDGERAPYDREVAAKGRVPSRERSWHDFLNMLAWAAFPRTKAAIHARQLEAARAEGPESGANRGRERDALAMIDEGGAILTALAAAEADVRAALTRGDQASYDALVRAGACTARLLGHAVYEHLVEARAGDVLAAAFVVPASPDVDLAAAERMGAPDFTPSPADLGRIPVSWIGPGQGR